MGAEHLKVHQFKLGHTLSVGFGRPKGSRAKLGEMVLAALAEDFTVHGAEAIKRVREKLPQNYLAAVVACLPKHHVSESANPFSELTDAELELLERHLVALRAKPVELEIEAEPVASGSDVKDGD